MPMPTPGDVHVNKWLTNILVGFLQKGENFVWNRVFPLVPSQHKGDKYAIWSREDFFRDEARVRAAGTESAGVGARVSEGQFVTEVYAAHHDVPDQVRANQDSPLDVDDAAAKLVAHKMMLKQERLFSSVAFAGSVWGRDRTGVAAGPNADQFLRWDLDGSDPIGVLRAEMITQAEKTGYMPNKFVSGARVWAALVDHADILERIKFTQKAVVTKDLIASLLDLDEYLVSMATENTAAEGLTGAYSFMIGKAGLLVYVPGGPSIFEPSAGYSFSWTGYLGATNDFGARVKSFYMPELASERVEGEIATAHKIVAPDCGTYMPSAVS